MSYVLISGNMGSGKTTLTHVLSERLGWTALYEAFEDNPYLRDFHNDMRSWAFHNQLYFLYTQFESHDSIQQQHADTIKDRGLYEVVEVYGYHLYRAGYMTGRDWMTLERIYHTLHRQVQPPELLIYLRGTTDALISRIKLRGRDFENAVERTFLEQLNERYDEWICSWQYSPILTIDIATQDTLETRFLDELVHDISNRRRSYVSDLLVDTRHGEETPSPRINGRAG